VLTNVSAPESSSVYRSLAAAARRIPSFRNGKPTHPSTLARWISRGIRLPDGSALKLAARRYPGGWAVCDEAVDDFIDRLTAARTGETVEGIPAAPAASRKAFEHAERELDKVKI
jgi:hypothetical protein